MRYPALIMAALLAGTLLYTAQPSHAQYRDCWDDVTAEETFMEPITGMPVTIDVVVGQTWSDARCGTIYDNGRVNPADGAAPAAIYCNTRGVEVYSTDLSGNGTYVFRATFAEIRRVPQTPAENTLIDGAGGFALYRLTSGEMQVNTPPNWEGKIYEFIWDGCEPPAETTE